MMHLSARVLIGSRHIQKVLKIDIPAYICQCAFFSNIGSKTSFFTDNREVISSSYQMSPKAPQLRVHGHMCLYKVCDSGLVQ